MGPQWDTFHRKFTAAVGYRETKISYGDLRRAHWCNQVSFQKYSPNRSRWPENDSDNGSFAACNKPICTAKDGCRIRHERCANAILAGKNIIESDNPICARLPGNLIERKASLFRVNGG